MATYKFVENGGSESLVYETNVNEGLFADYI